jgi:predicted DNA-binding WGR domain protein
VTPVRTDIQDWFAAQEPQLPYSVRLCRIEPDKNMARFYRLAVERDLFGMWCFIRERGRIGRGGQMRMIPYATPVRAHAAPRKQRHAKERREYIRG